MTARLATLPATTTATRKARKPAKRNLRKPYSRCELARVGAFAGVAISALGVSLPHLASEVGTLTGASALAGWFLAITIDAGMVVTKTHLSASGGNRLVAWAVIIACTLLSMVLNAHAFTTHASTTFGCVMGVVFGIFLPAFITSCSYLASGILARHE